jgi:hypothetical protein
LIYSSNRQTEVTFTYFQRFQTNRKLISSG